MRSLYKDQLPIVKTANYAGRLGESPENWPMEITSDLYKELPYLSDYDVNVNMERMDEERGYAFGYADIHNKTERPEEEHDEAGLPHIRIPIVVRERMRKPFSVYMDGERVMPLNEERVRESLFNPATFDLSVNPPVDPSLVEPLMPPHRSGIGMGGDYKLASVDEKLYATLMGKEKKAFSHISKQQWEAIYGSLEVQKLVAEYGNRSHPAVQNKVYEIATKMFGYHPKPEPAPPGKIMEFKQKLMEKKQKETQKAVEKGQKMMQDGQKQLQKAQGAKTASVDSLLLAIAPTVRDGDRDVFLLKVANDPTLIAGFKKNGGLKLIEKFAQVKLASGDDRLRVVADAINPTVVTVQKLPGGSFLVKSANNEAFAPDQAAMGQVIPPEEAADALGPEQAQGMEPGQIATATDQPVESTEPEDAMMADVADRFGEYLVQDMMGNQIMGWVFPTTMAWDGEFSEQPVALFTNGSAFAVQDSVAGELIGKSTSLPMSTPRGEGVFYEVTRAGARATAPLTVRGGLTGPDGGEMYTCQDFMGNEFQVHMSPELNQPQRVSDTEYCLPTSWKFMTLNGQTQLCPDPAQMNKMGAVKQAMSSVELFWNGAFNLEGGCGLDKVASKFRYDLDAVSAEFMLGLLGVDGPDIKEKLAQARRQGSVKLANLKSITTLGERYQEKVKEAQALAQQIPDLRRNLVKEAAALEDESTVDKVLALNFVNPENLSTFIGYLPELEQTGEKLAEMLLSGYLGMQEVPEGAVERTMKNLEEVALALKAVQHAEV